MQSWLGVGVLLEGTAKTEARFRGRSVIVRTQETLSILWGCHAPYNLVLGVYCARC